MRYQPSIGYTYMPNTKVRVPWGKGGYLVRTNAAGFRSDHEFVHDRTPGAFRALVFGDSQTAGEGVANAQRFTDLVERALPGIELYNYAVSGTGPDQQFLIYQEYAGVEHDLMVIALYVESTFARSRITTSKTTNWCFITSRCRNSRGPSRPSPRSSCRISTRHARPSDTPRGFWEGRDDWLASDAA
jgi:carbamoyltransferase